MKGEKTRRVIPDLRPPEATHDVSDGTVTRAVKTLPLGLAAIVDGLEFDRARAPGLVRVPPTQRSLGLRPGRVIDGRYVLWRRIGKGGFGTVWAAEHNLLGRKVAIKVLRPTAMLMMLPNLRERFRREARAMARIQHPNVVSIYDFGMIGDSGAMYIAMEWLEGHDLRVAMRDQGPMAPDRAMGLMISALSGLGEAHKQGIVHKDLKPENLFLVENAEGEHLKILDFGLAHLKEASDARLTDRQAMLGSLGYMAPEYLKDGNLTLALDVYQMALILIEMLQGARVMPPTKRGDDRIRRILEGRISICPELMKTPLWPVLAKALSRDPKRRYPDAMAFRGALQVVLAHHPFDLPEDLSEPVEIRLSEPPEKAAASGIMSRHTTIMAKPLKPIRLPYREPPPPVQIRAPASPTHLLESLVALLIVVVSLSAVGIIIGLGTAFP